MESDEKIPYEWQTKSWTSNAKEYFDIDFKRQKNKKKGLMTIQTGRIGYIIHLARYIYIVYVVFIYKNKMLTKVKNKKKKKKK